MIELRFLLDEDVSPQHVRRLAAKGFYAEHVVHIGRRGSKDWNLFPYAIEKSLIIVTKNAIDFLKLAASAKVHPGLLLLRDGGLRIDEEWEWIEPVVDHLQEAKLDPLNTVVDVTGRGVFRLLAVPPP